MDSEFKVIYFISNNLPHDLLSGKYIFLLIKKYHMKNIDQPDQIHL